MDKIFGHNCLRNEIVWFYENKLGTGGKVFDRRHDLILVYSKSDNWTFHEVHEEVKEKKLQPVTQKIGGKRIWLRDEDGKRIYAMSNPTRPVGDVWCLPIINPMASERIGYPTQKPERLLERVLEASSDEGEG
jgi:DNA modification methylase